MDAHLTDRTYRFLDRVRGKPIYYHHNKYQNAKEDKHYVTSDKYAWMKELYDSLDAGNRIAIPMSSLQEAELLYQLLTDKYDDKKIKLYSSKTSADEKKLHFDDVNTYWTLYDVIIYTPTISAGVSFEVEHYDKMFAYFSDRSCNVETCIQMMGRVRNISTNEYYVRLSYVGNNLFESVDDIKMDLYKRRSRLFSDYDLSNLHYDYDGDGNPVYQETDYFHLWLDNRRIRNISLNNFLKVYIKYIRAVGSSIVLLDDLVVLTDEEKEALQNERKLISDDIKETDRENIVDARDIDADESARIKQLMNNHDNISDDDYYAYQRYKLRQCYNWDGHIDKSFVKKYYNNKSKRIYRNLLRIYNKGTIHDSLLDIQTTEKEDYKDLMAGKNTPVYDLSRRYVFEKHFEALALVEVSGYNSICDESYVPLVTFYDKIKKNEKKIFEIIKSFYQSENILVPNLEAISRCKDCSNIYIKKITNLINRVTRTMYGIGIRKEIDVFRLHKSPIFNYKDDEISLDHKS